jgi:polar amino acid transport system permease protein
MEGEVLMSEFLDAFFNADILRQAWPLLLQGALRTLLFCVIGIPLAMAAGLLLSILAMSRSATVRWLQRAWVDVFRALPPLVLVVLIYTGLPFIGIELTPVAAVAVTFLLNLCSYFCEVFRAGIASVPPGQLEAARATGLSAAQAFQHVVLPQAVKNILPDIVSNVIEGVKLSTIGAVVAMPELLFQARQAQNITFNATPIVAATFIYFLALWPLVRLLSRLEHRSFGTAEPGRPQLVQAIAADLQIAKVQA